MITKKIFLQPSRIVVWGMSDLMDAQNGREIFADLDAGKLHFSVMMFDRAWTLRFSALDIDFTRCKVTLEVEYEDEDRNDPEFADTLRVLKGYVLRREFAMLDAMLLIGTPFEVACGEAVN